MSDGTPAAGAPTDGAAPDAGQAPAAGSGAPAGADWISALDPDAKHVATAKGWKTPLDPVRDYVALQKTLGADKVALPPKGADGKRDWSKWTGWNDLGRPEKPEGYAFAPPQGKTWSDAEKATHTELQKAMHEAGITEAQFQHVGKALGGLSAAQEAQSEAKINAEADAAEAALKGKFGAAYDVQMHNANRAMSMGGDAVIEAVTKSGLGRNPAFIEWTAKMGALVSEDDTVGNIQAGGSRGAGGALTPDQAKAEYNRIMGEANMDMKKHPYWNDQHPEHQAINARVLELIQMMSPKAA